MGEMNDNKVTRCTSMYEITAIALKTKNLSIVLSGFSGISISQFQQIQNIRLAGIYESFSDFFTACQWAEVTTSKTWMLKESGRVAALL
jgi:hypothetical protein